MPGLVVEGNNDGYLARCRGMQGSFVEGDTIEEAIFNCVDVIRIIASYPAERAENLGFHAELIPKTSYTCGICASIV